MRIKALTRGTGLLFLGLTLSCQFPQTSDQPTVVVYTSVDAVFARPIAERFEEETGIQVLLVPDTEETKSTGLLNRLIAERQRPRADVFWSGDPVRAAILKLEGVSASYKPPRADGFLHGSRTPKTIGPVFRQELAS